MSITRWNETKKIVRGGFFDKNMRNKTLDGLFKAMKPVWHINMIENDIDDSRDKNVEGKWTFSKLRFRLLLIPFEWRKCFLDWFQYFHSTR